MQERALNIVMSWDSLVGSPWGTPRQKASALVLHPVCVVMALHLPATIGEMRTLSGAQWKWTVGHNMNYDEYPKSGALTNNVEDFAISWPR